MKSSRPISIVTGGAGFIGVNLAQQLLIDGNAVVALDNLSLGTRNNIENLEKNKNFFFMECDLSKSKDVDDAFKKATEINGEIDEIWHLAANSDIPAGVNDSKTDLKDTFLTTFEVIRKSKKFGINKLYFASSSAVYGDWGSKALKETLGPLKPISNYGAMKLASEAQISVAADDFLKQAIIFRFPNVVGTPATHGVIYDFIRNLKRNGKLDVLGDGTQQKSYLHVKNLIDAMLFMSRQKKIKNPEIINIGCDDDGILISRIAELVRDKISKRSKIVYGHSNKGWQGDVPKFFYDISYLRSFGWDREMSSESAVTKAIKEVTDQLK